MVYRRIMPKAERLSKKWTIDRERSFEGNCEILWTIFQPRALSSNIPTSRKGVYLLIKFVGIMILSSFSNIPSSMIISFLKFQNSCGTVASLLFFLLPAVPRASWPVTCVSRSPLIKMKCETKCLRRRHMTRRVFQNYLPTRFNILYQHMYYI